MSSLKIRNSYHEMVYIYTKQFPGRVIPLVLLENGLPGFVVNAYINYLLMQGEQESTLNQKVNAVCQLYEYCKRFYGNHNLSETELRNLVFNFGSAKLSGTIQTDGSDPLNLYWKAVRPSTVKLLIRNIDAFDKFQETFFQSKRLNPVEVTFQNTFERYQEFRRRQKYDPFIHLFTAHANIKNVPQYAAIEHRRHSSSRRIEKTFPVGRVVELIEKTPEPRDKLLLLLMAFGGLRRSETLHIFHQDILGQFKDSGAAWVQLGDPVTGNIRWLSADETEKAGTRQQFLTSMFSNEQFPLTHPLRNLMPRCLYGHQGHGLQVGFKGMTFSGHEEQNFIHWLHEEAGCLFWQMYQQYLSDHFYGKPKHWPYHPFLFIRLDHAGYGLPLTLPSLEKIFARATARIGLTGYTPHSLRHLFGFYTASVLKRPIEEAQVCMHHASVLSTQIYYKVDPLVVRESMMLAASGVARSDPISVLNRLIFPKHWGCGDVLYPRIKRKPAT